MRSSTVVSMTTVKKCSPACSCCKHDVCVHSHAQLLRFIHVSQRNLSPLDLPGQPPKPPADIRINACLAACVCVCDISLRGAIGPEGSTAPFSVSLALDTATLLLAQRACAHGLATQGSYGWAVYSVGVATCVYSSIIGLVYHAVPLGASTPGAALCLERDPAEPLALAH